MRLFIAINLPYAMKDSLINMQNALYDRGVRGNYTSEENLHLTLAFIGEYPDAETVLDALSSVSFRPFELSLEGMGSFGDLWWAGMRESVPLTAVARRIRRALAENRAGACLHECTHDLTHALRPRQKRHDLHRTGELGGGRMREINMGTLF